MNRLDEGIDLNNFSIEEEVAKYSNTKVPLWKLLIRMYKASQTTESGLIMPDSFHNDQEYSGCVGLIVGMGPLAYKGERFHGEVGCSLGEWRIFPRHNALKIHHDGVPLFLLDDDLIGIHVDDPRIVSQ